MGTLHNLTADARQAPPLLGQPAPAPLSESQLSVLGMALDDATSHRAVAFSSRCTACDRSAAGLCSEHAADVDRISDYLDLAAQLGIAI
jgi:hypothetical protein